MNCIYGMSSVTIKSSKLNRKMFISLILSTHKYCIVKNSDFEEGLRTAHFTIKLSCIAEKIVS